MAIVCWFQWMALEQVFQHGSGQPRRERDGKARKEVVLFDPIKLESKRWF